MIKRFSYLFISCIFFALPLQATLEKRMLTKEEILIQLAKNDNKCIETMFNLCEGKISIQPKTAWDCSGILETMVADCHDFADIIKYLHQTRKLNSVFLRTNSKGETLLHIIARTNNISFLKVILTDPTYLKHIFLNHVDHQGNTPAHLVALFQEDPYIMLRLLENYGANLELRNKEQKTVRNILKQKAYAQVSDPFYNALIKNHDTSSDENDNEDNVEEIIQDYCSIS